MGKERNVLAQILKSWAQDHDPNFQIAAPNPGDEGVNNTGVFFTWLIKATDVNIDLTNLLDRLEPYVLNVKNKKYPDGMFCVNCGNYYRYAEPNQPDGSLICFACRSNPYP